MRNETPLGPRRRGFTLRELSITMAFSSAIMMASVATLHRAFDWSTTASHRRSDDQTFFRLSRQLRDDVVLASDVEVQPASIAQPADSVPADSVTAESEAIGTASKRLTLQRADDVSVIYTVSDQIITRTEQSADEVKRREFFRWKQPRSASLRFVEDEQQVRLEIRSVFPHSDEAVPLWRSIGATLGLRLRYQQGDIES